MNRRPANSLLFLAPEGRRSLARGASPLVKAIEIEQTPRGAPVTRNPKNSAGFGKPTVYGSATGPSVAAAPSRRMLPAHCLPGFRSDTASRLARCHATAPGTNLQHSE